jgi:hypothetical protein
MPNLARKSDFEMTSNIFSGEWIAWLDAITHRSFIEDSDNQFLDLFDAQADELGITGIDASNLTRSALNFLEKNGLKPLNIDYFRDGINGGLSVSFVIDLPDDDCYEYYDLMVKEIVSHNRSINFILMTFDIISLESL